ncbi:MAG: adenylate/guanylate cyclase domain-containing protein [Spirochaetaceae bacterium]|nr:MAG: adenylate/guanylate cyclase domain-containing protein [Spirochaetaceae bacterium]
MSNNGNGQLDDINSDIRESDLRRQIEEYYLPKQLVSAILEMGEIPRHSELSTIGVAFMDIADYTYLSKFLSPNENQDVLDGLYTAFNTVLKRHGGYLNKIEGDSLMFHYGGTIDPRVRGLDEEQVSRYIARELFFTCIEMQRVCTLFNQASDRFLAESASSETRAVLEKAFQIISTLRGGGELSSSVNALFQIRIRIGANIGEVTIGNFGPDGAKQWDVVGLPVIDAKRMESTAPVGGLRISEEFYRILEETGIADAYHQRFCKEAGALFGRYKEITKAELFSFSRVRLNDKKGARFNTYSIQVDPALPEHIADQAELLLNKGREGAARIVEILQYYRGNRFVLAAIEDLFDRMGVHVRKDFIFRSINPKKFDTLEARLGQDKTAVAQYIQREFSLFELFADLGKYQDAVKREGESEISKLERFDAYEEFLDRERIRIKSEFERKRSRMLRSAHFFNVVYPIVFSSLFGSLLEYQFSRERIEVL